MVSNGYNYHEKYIKKVDLNNPFYKQKRSSKTIRPIKRVKSREKTLTTFIPEMKRKVIESKLICALADLQFSNKIKILQNDRKGFFTTGNK